MIFSEGWMKKFKKITFSAINSFSKITYPSWRIHSSDYTRTKIVDFLRSELEKVGYSTERGDVLMRRILTHVHNEIEYRGDTEAWGMAEHWNTVDETIGKEAGDCEDGAIYIYIEAIMAGIDPNRINLVWGAVEGGGHCYVVYRRDSDGQEVPIDWCYWYNKKAIKNMLPYRDNPLYFYGKKEWGRCNHLRGFGGRI